MLKGELHLSVRFMPPFLQRVAVRIEDRAAVILVDLDDLLEPLLCGVAHKRQAGALDLPVELDEFEMARHFITEDFHHLGDLGHVIRAWVLHLQIGEAGVDLEGAQGRVVPGKLIGMRNAFHAFHSVGAEGDLALVSGGKGHERIHGMRRDH